MSTEVAPQAHAHPARLIVRSLTNLVRFASLGARLVAIAAAGRDDAIVNVSGQMNDRQMQDLGLSPRRMPAANTGFASAEAQLGMVR
jgi:hypothetical protein